MRLKAYESNKGWYDCEYESWKQIQDDGWVLEKIRCIEDQPIAIMSRNGFTKSFKEGQEL